VLRLREMKSREWKLKANGGEGTEGLECRVGLLYYRRRRGGLVEVTVAASLHPLPWGVTFLLIIVRWGSSLINLEISPTHSGSRASLANACTTRRLWPLQSPASAFLL
jgi:hypothetical protein